MAVHGTRSAFGRATARTARKRRKTVVRTTPQPRRRNLKRKV